MANTDRTRKLLVRTALVTSTTIATVVGAQNIAMLDALQFRVTETPTVEDVVIQPLDPAASIESQVALTVNQTAPQLSIVKSAPNIIILRHAGVAGAQQAAAPASNTTIIQPPVPSQLAPPAPIVIQQQAPAQAQQQVMVPQAPVVPRTRSTR